MSDIFNDKAQTAPQNLNEVSNALRQLDNRGLDTPNFLLTKADFYREAWVLAHTDELPTDFRLPGQSLDGTNSVVTSRTLGDLAEQNYQAYLLRNPKDPNREQIVRIKFKVAPWRIL